MTYSPFVVDSYNNHLITIRHTHHEVHEGITFSFFNTASLNTGNSLDTIIVTQDTTKWTHMLIEASFILGCRILLYEGVTFTGGSSATVFNRDRNSSTPNTTLVYTGTTPTIGTASTLLDVTIGGSTAGNFMYGGISRGEEEIILAQNTIYLFRLTSTVDSNVVNSSLVWYEYVNL